MLQLSLPKRTRADPDLLELQASLLDDRSSFAAKLKAAYEGGLVQKAELMTVCKETIERVATCVNLPTLVTTALEELAEAPAELSLSLIKGLMAGSSKIGAYKNLPELTLKLENCWKQIHPKTLNVLTNFKLLHLKSDTVLAHCVELWGNRNYAASISVASDFHLNVSLESEVDGLATLLCANMPQLLEDLIQRHKDLARKALKLCNHKKHSRIARKLFDKFKLDPHEFPEIVELMKTLSIRFFLKQPLGVVQLLDLFDNSPAQLGKLMEYVVNKWEIKNHQESGAIAKYLAISQPDLRNEVSPLLWEKVKRVQLEPFVVRPDAFGPYNPECLRLPLDRAAVVMISSVDQVNEIQWTANIYGLDTEWRPSMTKLETSVLSILTVASFDKVWVIDLVQLRDSPEVKAKLAELFIAEPLTKLGFGFHADLGHLELAGFSSTINNLVDIQEVFKRLEPGSISGGLGGMCLKYLKQPLCKQMQITNWSRRPLREAQMHYAALDAYVLLDLWVALSN